MRRHGWVRAGCRGQVSVQWARRAERSAPLSSARFSTLHHHQQRQPKTPAAPTCGTLNTREGARHGDHQVTWQGGGGWGCEPPVPSAEGRAVRREPAGAPRRGLGAGRYPEPGRWWGGGPAATYILSETSKRPSTIISGRKSSLNEEVMLGSGGAAAVGGRMRRGAADPTTAPGGGAAGTGAEASPRQPPAPAVVTFLSPSRFFPPIPSEIDC